MKHLDICGLVAVALLQLAVLEDGVEAVERAASFGGVGADGVGEGGMIVAPACITNAIEDALAPLGVHHRRTRRARGA